MALLLEEAYNRLAAAADGGRLGHAYLVQGPRGAGKRELVRRLACRLLRVEDSGLDAHPDFHTAEPESKSRRIVIDQIRELDRSLQMRTLLGGKKVAVIFEADRLQPQAANAFLKTLEEPPDGCHIFLISSLPEAMLETILSRCIEVPLQSSGPKQLGDAERLVRTVLQEVLEEKQDSAIGAAFRFTRAFQDVLTSEKKRVADEFEDLLDREKAHYKQSADNKWLEEREDQIKAMTEASVMRERSRLVQVVIDVYGNALRQLSGAHLPEPDPVAAKVASMTPAQEIIRKIETLEDLRQSLERTTQEALALETGFLELFAPLK